MLAIGDSNHYELSRNTTPYYLKREYGIEKADILKQIFDKLEREETSVFLKFPWAYINFHEHNHIYSTACWKIHISATLDNYQEIFLKVSEYALKYKINFKFTSSIEAFRYINSKQISPVSAGKFIVLYPLYSDLFETVLEDLDSLLKGYDGPVILSDRVYKGSKNIYYRYGEYRPIYKLSERGNLDRYILDDKFTYNTDVRKSYYYCPDWIKDKNYSYESDSTSLVLNKYQFTEIITNRGSITTFVAYDIETREKVFIKEARKYLGLDSANYYSPERLLKEYTYLSLLKDTGVTPKPIEYFEEQGNVYLIEEFIENEPLASWLTRNNHLYRSNCSKKEKKIYLERVNSILINIIKALLIFRKYNLFLNDISVHNILVDNDLNVVFIDFEYAYFEGDTDVALISTPGFDAESGLEEESRELSKVIKLLLSLFIPMTTMYEFFVEKLDSHLNWYLSEYNNYLCKETRNLFYLLINSKITQFSDLENIILNTSPLVIKNKYTKELNVNEHINKSIKGILSSFAKCRDEEFYFPADPHIFNTNYYSVAHGVFGVLYSLQVVNHLTQSFKEQIMANIVPRLEMDDFNIPGGLLYGYAGISWALLDMGYTDLAEKKLALSNRILTESFSFCYGLSGTLLANIKFYLKTRNRHYYYEASKIVEKIVRLNPKDIDDNGFGLGLSGIVYSLSYWYELNKDKKIMDCLVMFLNEEISRLSSDDKGNIFINREGNSSSVEVYSPYVYDGIAGVGIALIRLYKITKQKQYLKLLSKIIPSCFVELTVHPSYMRGMAGIADFLLDTLNVIDDRFLLEKIENHVTKIINNLELFFDDVEQLHLGEQLFKLSADLTTGTSGILLVLKRYQDFKKTGLPSSSYLFNLDSYFTPIEEERL